MELQGKLQTRRIQWVQWLTHNVNKAYASRKLCGYEVTSIPNLVLFELETPVHVNSKCFLKQ